MAYIKKNKLLVFAALTISFLLSGKLEAAQGGEVLSATSAAINASPVCPVADVNPIANINQLITFSALMAGSSAANSNCNNGGGGPTNLSVDLNPNDPSLFVGDTVGWHGQAFGGTPPYHYTLQFGATILLQETTSGPITYSMANIQELTNEGPYSLNVIDATGTGAFDLELLSITVAPSSTSLALSPSSSVNAGQSVTFTATANGGDPATNYEFFRDGISLQSSNSNIFRIFTVDAGSAGSYTAIASNDAGNSPESNGQNLVVTISPFSASLNFNPSASVVPGTVTNAVASISSGTGPFTYTFFKGLTEIASYPGVMSNSQTHPLGAATAAMAGGYSVTISNTAGSVNASNSLQVIPTAGLYIDVIGPANGQQGVSLQPTYQWILYNNGVEVPSAATPGTQFKIKITNEFDCENAQGATFYFPSKTSRDFTSTVNPLNQDQHYFVCALLEGNGGPLTAYDTNHFFTQQAEIPLVSLHTNPTSTETQPSGHINFQVIANAPETGSLVRLYAYDSQGLLVGQVSAPVALDNSGQAIFLASVSNPQQIETMRFKARIQRSGVEFGPLPAATTNYYYDPAAGLQPPVIEFSNSTCDGNLEWMATGETHTYKVFSRKNEDLLPMPLVGEFYNFNQAPYKFIADVPALGAAGLVQFNDLNFNNPAIGPEGISYFVTASDGSLVSRRSNAVSCQDINNNDITDHNLQILEGQDGRTLSFYLIENLAQIPHAKADNDPERYAYVQLTPTGTNCTGITWDNNKDTTPFHFDALTRITDPSRALSQAIPIGSATFETGTAYCAVVCMTDSSTTRTVLQSRSEDFSNHPELCMEPRRVTLKPNFDGIKQLIPQNDGESMKVKWAALITNPEEVEFVDYRVEAVRVSAVNEIPDFTGSVDASITVQDITSQEVMLSGLETGAYYAVRVVAVATQLEAGSNQFGGEVHLTDRTVDLHPQIQDAKLTFDYGTMTEARLTLTIRQLQPSPSLTGLGREPIQVSFNGFSAGDGQDRVERINDIGRAVISGSEFVSGAVLPQETSTLSLRLNTSEVLQKVDKNRFVFNVEVKNSMGLSGKFTGIAKPGDGLSAGSENRGGCLNSLDGRASPTPWMLVVTTALLCLIGIRRRLKLQGNNK